MMSCVAVLWSHSSLSLRVSATGASWLVRQIANFKYTDYHVCAIEEFQDERYSEKSVTIFMNSCSCVPRGDWQVAALGIFGLWVISTQQNGIDIIKAD